MTTPVKIAVTGGAGQIAYALRGAGKIRVLHAEDSVLESDAKGRPMMRAEKMDPIARLGAGNYAGLAKFAKLKRPD